MKNVEKYLDKLLKDTDEFNCTCCALRLGHCLDCDNITNVECEHYKELNKQWLKAEYVPKEAIYILKSFNPEITHIRKLGNGDVIVSNSYIPLPGELYVDTIIYKKVENVISDVFQSDVFDFLPSEDMLINDILKQYKDIY